jgi:hypothetical protein
MTQEGWTWNDVLKTSKSLENFIPDTNEGIPASLSVSDVGESADVLATVSSIGIIFLLLMVLTRSWDEKDKRSEVTSSSLAMMSTKMLKGANRKSQRLSRLARPTQSNSHHSSLIDRSLPSIFQSDSLWLKFKQEMKVYHRWLGIVFYYSPEFPRAMRVLSLFSSIMIMLFIQSVTYNIADPDDGSCEDCEDESCCLSLKSTLNTNEDRCSWKVDDLQQNYLREYEYLLP